MRKFDRQRRTFLLTSVAQGLLLLNSRELLALGCEPRTPEQTEGPFYPKSFLSADMDLTGKGKAQGDIYTVTGRVVDTDCRPIAGAQVDLRIGPGS